MVIGGIPGYERLVEVGRDGDADIFHAWQPAFNRNVAVHLVRDRHFEDLEADARRTAPLAGHPNVVTVHELGVTTEGIPYLVTEPFDDGSLAERLAVDGAIDWYDAAAVTVKVAGVVQAAGWAGIAGLTVTPADVFLSRFGEPKVALFHRLLPSGPKEADGLRTLLGTLLGDGADASPAGVRAALGDPALDPSGVARRLQRAQEEAGRTVTGMPTARATEPSPSAQHLSEVETVAPLAPAAPRGRNTAWVAGVVLLAGAALGSATLLGGGESPATTTTTQARQTIVTPAPALYDSAGFTSPEWKTIDGPEGLGVTVTAGTYRIVIRGHWGIVVWRGAGQRRVSVTVAASIAASSDVRLDVHCGFTAPGSKYLTASVRPDASWEIRANDGVLSSGSAPGRAAELAEPFLLRMDCVTDATPSRATLFLNNVMLGTGRGTGSYPMNAVLVGTEGRERYEVWINSVTIRRLE